MLLVSHVARATGWLSSQKAPISEVASLLYEDADTCACVRVNETERWMSLRKLYGRYG